MLNWNVKNKTVWSFNRVFKQNVFTNQLFNLYIWKQDLAFNNHIWYAQKLNQTKPNLALVKQLVWEKEKFRI